MRCETAQAVLSAAMDETDRPAPAVPEHAGTCPRCTAFSQGARRLRTAVRFQIAPQVPDLVPDILRLVREEPRPGRSRPGPLRRLEPPSNRRLLALGLAAGLLVGFVLTAGGVVSPRRANTAALAAAIPGDLLQAAAGLDAYRATFDITELHWTREVARRTFVATLAFRAPESFQVRVGDTTRYPSAAWPRNDLRMVTDGRTWTATGPNPCPRAALPACPEAGPTVRSIVHRAPFDAQSPLPTDVIVPMTVLAASDRVDVLGSGQVGGRAAILVQLAYQDATPLFQYLQFLGSWRPMYPQDRVVVWLDRRTWFPLQYRVFPVQDPARRVWEAQNGLPHETSLRPVFAATVRSLSTAAATFRVDAPPGAVDEGFRDAGRAGRSALLRFGPRWTAGLQPWRVGSFVRTDARPFGESVLAFARGLSWATLTRVTRWDRQAAFGVGPFAEAVSLPHGHGTGFYEPASAGDPRRVALHTDAGELLIASNLPRATLLRMAWSLPVAGLPQPASWHEHRWAGGSVVDGLTQAQAVSRAGFPVVLPRWLPPGYRAAGAEVARTLTGPGVTLVFRRPAAELDGAGVTLTEFRGQALPPPVVADALVVTVGDVTGRWSPDEHRLEWVQDGVYRSLTAPGLDLTSVLAIADSLRPPGGSP